MDKSPDGLLDFMISQHCKVLFVRFDLRFPTGTIHRGRSTEISQLMRALKCFYKENGIAIHYIWTREQCNSEAPHYHVIVLLNGSLIRNPMAVWAKASEFWSWITDGPAALVHQSGGLMIRRPTNVAVGQELLDQQQAFQADYGAAMEWGSYLAKEFSKGNTPFRMREYDSSRL